jgi:predicted GIY-YIG superfamily endonuclease
MTYNPDKRYFIYVLWSPIGRRFYIGITEDIAHRLEQHNEGLSRWTARYRPWTVDFRRECVNYTEARKQELELKSQKGGVGFYKLTGLKSDLFREPD